MYKTDYTKLSDWDLLDEHRALQNTPWYYPLQSVALWVIFWIFLLPGLFFGDFNKIQFTLACIGGICFWLTCFNMDIIIRRTRAFKEITRRGL